ncbi:hypothetical protein [Methylobacterium komagatae]
MALADTLVTLDAAPTRDEFDVELIVPASCDAPLGEAVNVLRQGMRRWP